MKYRAVIFDLSGTLVDKFPVDESIDVLREMAAERLSVEPEECLYIGDGDSGEINGAAEADMRAVLIRVTDGKNGADGRVEEWTGPTISSLTDVMKLLK